MNRIMDEEEAVLRSLQDKIRRRNNPNEKEIIDKIEFVIKTLKKYPNMSGEQISHILGQNGIDCYINRIGDFK